MELCHSLIDEFQGRDVVDAARDYAQHIPMRVIAGILGFPPEDAPQFREFVENTLQGINLPPEQRVTRMSALFYYLLAQVQDHLSNPRDDLTTYLINAELDGRELDPSHIVGTMALLLIAGIDTTWSAIGASLWHLAKTPEDRRRLVADPGLLPVAIEEFLRAYAPVTMARLVKQDMHWRGADMKADDWILLSYPAANRDPAEFDRAGEVVIDREVNRHAAFGLGVHRCLGSHLARMELRVALGAWLERFPEFTLADPAAVTWAAGQVRGPAGAPAPHQRLRFLSAAAVAPLPFGNSRSSSPTDRCFSSSPASRHRPPPAALAAYMARSASASSWSATMPGADSAAPIDAVGDTFSSGQLEGLLDGLHEPGCDAGRLGRRRHRVGDHDELVAAEPADGVLLPWPSARAAGRPRPAAGRRRRAPGCR